MPTGSPSSPLPPLPDGFAATRAALHTVAEQIVAPARKPENEIALSATHGGFGTPPFEVEGVACQVRVEGAELIYRRGEDERRVRLTSLAAGAVLVAGLLPGGADLDDSPLAIDDKAAGALGAWYEFGAAVLGVLREEAVPGGAPSDAWLWPEHFDIAIEAGDEQSGRRANYGFSPGDEHHDEPYLYVGPWDQGVSGSVWNATGFVGAEIGYADLQTADDQTAAALDFCRQRRDALEAKE